MEGWNQALGQILDTAATDFTQAAAKRRQALAVLFHWLMAEATTPKGGSTNERRMAGGDTDKARHERRHNCHWLPPRIKR